MCDYRQCKILILELLYGEKRFEVEQFDAPRELLDEPIHYDIVKESYLHKTDRLLFTLRRIGIDMQETQLLTNRTQAIRILDILEIFTGYEFVHKDVRQQLMQGFDIRADFNIFAIR